MRRAAYETTFRIGPEAHRGFGKTALRTGRVAGAIVGFGVAARSDHGARQDRKLGVELNDGLADREANRLRDRPRRKQQYGQSDRKSRDAHVHLDLQSAPQLGAVACGYKIRRG